MGELAHRLDISIGSLAGNRDITIALGNEELATHLAIFGGTGRGKSKLVEQIFRQLIEQGGGGCVVDPHGDLVEDILAYILQFPEAIDPEFLKKIHYFEPGSQRWRFSLDQFVYHPIPGVDPEIEYPDWLAAKIDSVAQVIIRMQGEADFEGRPRLERYLTDVLYGVGAKLDHGGHLPLADALLLLDFNHPQHGAVYAQIAEHLPDEVRADFETLRAAAPRQREEWTASTIGRLRTFLRPGVRTLFANKAKEAVDFEKIIANGEIMLVNLRRTRSFSHAQANAIGGMFIDEILEAAEISERWKRIPYFLFIDEASRFAGQDLIDSLAQARKWKLSVGLAFKTFPRSAEATSTWCRRS